MTLPRPMLLFAWAYGATMLVNLVHGVVAADSHRLAMPEMAIILGDAFMPLLLSLRLAFAGWLGWLIVFRASNLAKWFVVLLIAAKMVRVGDAWTGLQTANVNSILWTTSSALALAAVACLFLPASRVWFAGKGRSAKSDALVFD